MLFILELVIFYTSQNKKQKTTEKQMFLFS